MLYGGDGPGPLLTAASASGWKMKATDRNNCLSWLIILYVGIADNCTFIFTTKYTDTLSIMQRKFLILFMKFAKRGDLIHCTPDKTQKQSAGAERNFSGDSPWVINDKSSSQAQGPSWCGYHFYCSVSYSNVLCLKNKPAASSLRVWYLSSNTINYFRNEQRCNLELWRKERFSAQYLFVIMILLPEVEQNNRPINLICWSPSGWRGCLPTYDCTGPSSPEQKYY